MNRKYSEENSVLLLDIYLHEYDRLREEISTRLESSSQLQIASILGLGSLLPLVNYVEKSESYSLYLMASLVFLVIAWSQIDHEYRVAEMGWYITCVLRKQILKIVDDNNLLGWEIFWRQERYRSRYGVWLSMGSAARIGVNVLAALWMLVLYVIGRNPLYIWSDFALFVSVIFGVIWVLLSAIMLRKKYRLENGVEDGHECFLRTS